MNYAAHYARLIERARGRVLPGYVERHHVLPRCLGGTNAPDNMVDLTPEEHYVAHQLLVKMYPNCRGLVIGATFMAGRVRRNKVYGWLRKRHSAVMSAHMSVALIGNKNALGLKHSAETRARMSASRRGRKVSPESRAKRSVAMMGNILSPEARAKISAAHTGVRENRSPEGAARLSQAARRRMLSDRNPMKGAAAIARRGIPLSEETRAKLSAARLGYKATPAARANQSRALRGRKFTPEHAAKLAAHLRSYWEKRRAAEVVA